MYCIYRTTEVANSMIGKTYLERMDQTGAVVPILADHWAYVTATNDGHYSIANSAGEVLAMGNTGIDGVRDYLKQLRPLHTLVNGADYETYRIANSALVYFIYIRKTKDRQTYFVAVEKTREGHSQQIKVFTGSLKDVQERVRRYLSRSKENYYVHYLNKAYRLPGAPERYLFKEFEHDEFAIRDALRPHVSTWKERQVNEAA